MRLRVTFAKSGPLIYVGNLDLLTIWERAARRAGLALEYSKGFHPQPKIQIASPLPLGFSSRCEILDMRLSEDTEVSKLAERLQAVLPSGILVLDAAGVDPEAPALPTQVEAAQYEITWSAGPEMLDLEAQVQALLGASSVPRERRGKRYDLRPLIEELLVVDNADNSTPKLLMRLTALEGATGRPDEVLEALGLRRADARIERTALILKA